MTDRSKTSVPDSAGARFRAALAAEKPLQIVGAINAYHARLAKRSGFKAYEPGYLHIDVKYLPQMAEESPAATCSWRSIGQPAGSSSGSSNQRPPPTPAGFCAT